MANWYYYDENGQKQGPITSPQLQALAVNGVITPSSRIATEDGREGAAGSIPGLKFPPPPPPPLETTGENSPFRKLEPADFTEPSYSRAVPALRSNDSFNVPPESTSSPILWFFKWFFYWLFDYKFKSIYYFAFIRIIIRVVYIIALIYTVVGIAAVPFTEPNLKNIMEEILFREELSSNFTNFLAFLDVIGHILSLVVIRFACEFWIFFIDWLVNTNQAAKRIIAEKDWFVKTQQAALFIIEEKEKQEEH
jgi:hypothetical protein